MSENRFPYPGAGNSRETVCIETNRVMDSCRDRDCFENTRVYLSGYGSEILDRTSAIRPKDAKILWTNIALDPIPFNRGFYAVNMRFFVGVTCETCMGVGRGQDLHGIAVLDKKVILYGGDSGTGVFRSTYSSDGDFCSSPAINREKNSPTATVEVVDPVFLDAKIREHCEPWPCCVRESDIPEFVQSQFDSPIRLEDGDQYLTVSLGIFSVIRITRPGQYLVQASEYVIPEKECVNVEEDNPCCIFRNMPFPVDQFSTLTGSPQPTRERQGRCGCGS